MIAELEMHLCYYDGLNFFFKTVDSGHPNATLNPGEEGYENGHSHGIWNGREYPYNPTPVLCLPIHLVDRLQMLAQVVFLACKYVILVRLYYNSLKIHVFDGTLVDLSGLDEFDSSNIMQTFERREVELSTIKRGGGRKKF
jgi:hypothetical protein